METDQEEGPPQSESKVKTCLRRLGKTIIRDFGFFKVLMWKHMMVRKRRFIKTFFELVCPCLLFLILFGLKQFLFSMLENEINKALPKDTKKTALRSFDSRETMSDTLLVMYTPMNTYTNELMDRVGFDMNLHRLDIFPDEESRGYYGFSEEYLPHINYIASLNDYSAVVQFHNMDDLITWPGKLRYTIQINKKFFRNLPAEEQNNHHGMDYQLILRLQWAIDSNFMKIISREKLFMRSEVFLPVLEFSESFSDFVKGFGIFIALYTFAVAFGILLPFIFFYTTLMEDRGSGMQGLIKQAGVPYRVMTHAHGSNMIPIGLVFSICGTLVAKLSAIPFLPHTSGFLIFLALEFYFHSFLSFAFLCTFVNKTGRLATTLGILIFVLIYIVNGLLAERKLKTFVRLLTGLLPFVPMSWIMREVLYLETNSNGLNSGNMNKAHTDYSLAASTGFLMMFIQIVLYLLITMYLNVIFPGKYGVGEPWNFCCKVSVSVLWYFKKKQPVLATALDEVEEERKMPKNPKYFESTHPTNVGIHIEDVCKIFGRNVVLSNVSFNAYKGELTVLLGHNGAGKTTLMSIITGILAKTNGKVLVNGHDITTERSEAQSAMGLCPQHNIFFPAFSVMEHVMFFAMIRGSSYKQARESSEALLDRLGLGDKKNFLPNQLSGGMKRRLQLACALSGNAEVLILDEPTSGLDVENRRNLWNLLLSLRGSHTVLLTTHFMEEADALADRIVALHQGRLRCHATPMYLKKNIGAGYRLSLTTHGLPKQSEITAVITSAVPSAVVKESSLNTISYSLPSQDTSRFAQMFSALETKKTELEIESIGMGVSSLEEVFLMLCSDTDTQFTEENISTQVSESQYSKVSGCRLYLQQMVALWKRQLHYLNHIKFSFIAFQVLLPAVCIFYLCFDTKDKHNILSLSQPNNELYDNNVQPIILLRANSSDSMEAVKKIKNGYKNVIFQYTDNVADAVFRASEAKLPEENKNYVFGLDMNGTNAQVVYSSVVRHAAPISLNVLSNVLAAQYLPKSEGKTITTNYKASEPRFTPLIIPLPIIKNPLDIHECVGHVSWVSVLLIFFITFCVDLPAKERVVGTRHVHLMSGVPPVIHWLSTWLWHIGLYGLLLLLPASLFFFASKSAVFCQGSFVGSLLLILLVGSMPLLLFCYILSFCYSFKGVSIITIVVGLLCGLLPALAFFALFVFDEKIKVEVLKIIFNLFYYLFPMSPLILAIFKATNVARLNALCNINLDKCPLVLAAVMMLPSKSNRGFSAGKCCSERRGNMCTLCSSEFGVSSELLTLLVQTIVYGILILMIQHGIFNGMYDRLFNLRYQPSESTFQDNNVQREKAYVTSQTELAPTQRPGCDAVLINHVHKKYFRFCGKSVNAVKGIGLSVKKGECFGILGVNGAGKSTLFKLIVAEEVATRGNVHINETVLKWPRSGTYLKSLGYCPQYFDMDDFQTGNNNLLTLLRLRGFNAADAKTEANIWIQIVGLERYRDQKVSGYSGGCARRLATAAALSGGAPVTLLDEPTSGVDVSARRRVWVALRKGLRQHRAVIITSHSMDEMEALCDRIAIMSAGEVAALGSAPALRAAHATGHSLAIKLVPQLADPQRVEQLKSALSSKFSCTLIDQYTTMLQYHINENLPYSSLFTMLEGIKSQFQDVIEDYSVTETSLEEVFLSFTPKATEEKKQKKRK